MSGSTVLKLIGRQPHAVRTHALRFRQHNIALLHPAAPQRHCTRATSNPAEAQVADQGGRTGWSVPSTQAN